MNFRIALKSDKPQLYRLWQEAFGDSEKVIDRFFESVISFENITVCADGERIVSMLSLLPVKVVLKNRENLNALCVYAAATDIKYRRRGIMSLLLSFSCDLAVKRNADLLFLHPASESLYKYYEKNGFENAFYVKSRICLSEIDDGFSYCYVDWDKSVIKLNSELSENNSFFCEYGYADYCESDGRITVNAFSGGCVTDLIGAISEKTGVRNILVSLPADSSDPNAYPQGMIKRLNGKKYDNIYLGITLE